MSVVFVYTPTNPSSASSDAVSALEACYDQLQSTLSSIPSSNLLVILGDFNAHVGSDHSSWDSVIGPHGIGECNKNGERLPDFACGLWHLCKQCGFAWPIFDLHILPSFS